jgi:predicted dehydrogenase
MHGEPMKIGVIGCGYWGINYVRVFTELPRATVAGAVDRRPDRLQLMSQRFPTLVTCDDYETILIDPAIDAVVVATPASQHYAVVKECLRHGKHVLVEKPMTTRVDHAEELVSLANAQGVTLMVGYTFLYNGGIRKVKSLLKSDDFGEVYYLYATRTNLGPLREDVSAIWDLAPHDISIFDYLLDQTPVQVSAIGARPLRNNREDVGFITLTYANGVVGHIHVSWADPQKVRQVVIVGSRKRIVFDDVNTMEQVRVFEKGVAPAEAEANSFGEYSYLVRDGDVISPKIEASEPLKNQCLHFLDVIEGKATPLSDGRKGLEVARIMAAVEKSLSGRGYPVNV